MPFPNSEFLKDTIQRHFKKKKIEITEDSLISVINNPKSGKYDVYWAVIALRDVGTSRCIKTLKEVLHYPMQDVKDCSLLTISHIAGEKETDYYVRALRDKKTKKDYPIWAIRDSANEKAVPGVIEYLESVYKKWKQPACKYAGSAYFDALLFLEKYAHDREEIKNIFKLFGAIKHKIPANVLERLQRETTVLRLMLQE